MYEVTTNEGVKISVPANIYAELQSSFNAGDFAAYYTSDKGQTHAIILADQIQFFNQIPIQ